MMFDDDESSNSFVIDGIEAEHFYALLEFIYTNCCKSLNKDNVSFSNFNSFNLQRHFINAGPLVARIFIIFSQSSFAVFLFCFEPTLRIVLMTLYQEFLQRSKLMNV